MKDRKKINENMSTDFIDKPKRNNKKEKTIKIEDFDNNIKQDLDDDIFLENKNETRSNIYKKELNYNYEKNNEKINNKKEKINPFFKFLFFIMLLISSFFIFYTFYFGSKQLDQTNMIINSIIIFIVCLFMVLYFIKKKNLFMFLSSFAMISLISFNLLNNSGYINLPQKSIMKDFTGKNITEAIKWADANNIKTEQIYENSDNTEEYHIISQNVYPNTLIDEIKNLEFVVSSGPDYNKEITLADMTGWNIDEAVKEIDKLFLNNVGVDYIDSENEVRDTIIEQNRNGQMKRNDELKLKVSIGQSDSLVPTKMIELKNMSLFKSTLWLKRNGIKYELKYEFSDKIKRNHVIDQSTKKGTIVKPNNDIVILTISKGKKIIVPDLTKMSVKEITNWVVQNKLMVEFINRYDSKINQGKIIDANYKKNDEVEEGTKIRVMVSKGQLKMKKFTDLNDFRTWANKYGIKFREEYIQDKNVEMGKIIKFSVEEGNIINPDEEIIIYISSGENILVPKFIGRTKTDIQKSCNDLGLNCTFYYAGLSSKEKDIALSQNKKAGSEVLKNTYVNIGLSSGKTNGNNNVSNDTTKPNNGNNSGGNKPIPTPNPTPIPSCNFKQTVYIYDELIKNNWNATCDAIKGAYKNLKFSCNHVQNSGLSSGLVLNSNEIDGKTFSNCDTIRLTIIQN